MGLTKKGQPHFNSRGTWPLTWILAKKPHNHPVLSYLSKLILSNSTQIVESQLSYLMM